MKKKNKNVRYSNEDLLSRSPRLYPKIIKNGKLHSHVNYSPCDCDITITDEGMVVVRGWQMRWRQPIDSSITKIVWRLTKEEFMQKVETFQIGCVPLDLMEKIERKAQ